MNSTVATRTEQLKKLGASVIRGLMLVLIGGSLVIGGCLIVTSKSVTVTNVSGRPITELTISANRQVLMSQSLQADESRTIHFATAFDAEYVIDAIYPDGTTLHQTVGYIDPLIGSADTVDIGNHEVVYNKRFKRTGSSPRKTYP